MDAVVFDMDGVLVDSELHWVTVESTFLGGILGSWTEADQHSILGRSLHDIYDMLRAERGLRLAREEFVTSYQSLADEIYGVHSSMFPGAKDLLNAVASSEARTGLASSSPESWINIVLDRFSLRPLFETVASGDHVPGRGKPHPDIYLLAARSLSVVPGRCVAIEDSSKGLAAAKNAGFKCVGFKNGFNYHQDLSAADLVISSFELLALDDLRKLVS